jgi:aspartate/methionine/tyrosine aminotransferase
MAELNRTMQSPYMRWAKSNFHARYNLANSGLMSYKLSQLPIKIEDIELNGTHYYGYEPLLSEIGKRYNVGTENIFTTLGASFANYMVLSVLYEPDAEILIEHPTYELIISAAEYTGYKVKRFDRKYEDDFQIDPSSIIKQLTRNTKLIVITNLHNPSSILTGNNTLKEIGKIAESVGAYVCVDEVYLDAISNNKPSSAIHTGNNFIVTNSLTKIYGLSGIRSGWVFAQPELIKKMWLLNDLFYVKHAYSAEQLSVIAFQNLDSIAKWSYNILSQNHSLLKSFLAKHLFLRTKQLDYGTTAFIGFEVGKVTQLSELLLKKYDTAITPGMFFGMPDFFRIGLGCEPADFREGLNRLGLALNELKK